MDMTDAGKGPALPGWLLSPSPQAPASCGRGKTRYLKKTLASITAVFRDALLYERCAAHEGLLQMADPRIKLPVFLFYIVLGAATNSITVLLLLFLLSALYAQLSHVGTAMFLRRVWLSLPLVLLLVSLPGATSLFVPGAPLFTLVPGRLVVTQQGAMVVLRTVLRAGVALSFGSLLFITSRWSRLVQAMSVLKLPALVCTMLGLTYRYLFLLAESACDMVQARFLRTAGRVRRSGDRLFVAHSAAYLFARAHTVSEEVYGAMRCRCYTGKPVFTGRRRLQTADAVFAVMNVLIAVILLLGEVIL